MPKSTAARWIVVAAATLGLAAAFGAISTISILIGPFESEFGWLRSETAFAYTLLTIGAALGGLVAGRLADRFPTAPIAMTGAAVLGLGLMLVGLQSSIAAIQAIYLTLGFLGFACLYAPLLSTVTAWFDRGLGLALGIVMAGGTIGQAVVPPVFEAMVRATDWRTACTLQGAATLILVLPAMALVRKPGRRVAVPLGRRADWPLPPVLGVGLIGAAALFCCGLMGVPTVHLIAFVSDQGHGGAAAARVATILMLAGCVGRIATGALVDRIGALPAYAIVSAGQTAAVSQLLSVASLPALGIVAAVYGLGFGGVMTAMVCAVRDAVPAHRVGGAMAVVGLLAWAGMGAGGLQAGLCFDRTGSYDLSFQGATLSGLANLACLGALAVLIRLRSRSAPTF